MKQKSAVAGSRERGAIRSVTISGTREEEGKALKQQHKRDLWRMSWNK